MTLPSRAIKPDVMPIARRLSCDAFDEQPQRERHREHQHQ